MEVPEVSEEDGQVLLSRVRARTAEILATTLTPPKELGVTHWPSRLLAKQLRDVSHVTITRLWKRWQLQPWREKTCRFATDPQPVAKLTDSVGLYPNPPGNDRAGRR